MGICCIKQQTELQNYNNKQQVAYKQKDFTLSFSKNNQKFTYFLKSFKVQQLLYEYAKICKNKNNQKWVDENRQKILNYIKQIKQYIVELNDNQSNKIKEIKNDIKAIQQTKRNKVNPQKQEIQQFSLYLIKLQIQSLFDSDNQLLGIRVFDQNNKQPQIFFNKQVEIILGKTNNFYCQFFVQKNSLILFILYPSQQKLTLHASQFLKYIWLDKKLCFNTIKISQNYSSINKKSTINIRMQIIFQPLRIYVQKLRNYAKNLNHQLQMILNGQKGWNHTDSLKSSFQSNISNIQSFCI